MKIVFLVVLYNTHISESKTIGSYINNIKLISDFEHILSIVNNGPNSLLQGKIENECFSILKNNFINFEYFENIENRPLSVIYNECITTHNDIDYVVLLDQDSELTTEYFQDLISAFREDVNLFLPVVISNGVKKYPKQNKTLIDVNVYVCQKKLASVTSGLGLSKTLVSQFIEKYGSVFDQRFALYGVDSSFFLRLQKLNNINKIKCGGLINHSLSSDQEESREIKSFRYIERMYDLALQTRHYPTCGLCFHMVRTLLKLLLKCNFRIIFILIKSFLIGCHPRAEKYN